jgi:hypothetical protein
MKKRVFIATASAIAILILASGTPAYAAGNAIHAGDLMYSLNCDPVYNDFQFFSVESSTAFSTKIGNGTGEVSEGNACAGQPAYNPATGASYYIDRLFGGQVGQNISLATVDRATGVTTVIGQFTDAGNEANPHPTIEAMAIGASGSAYALGGGNLWSVNLATAQLTFIVAGTVTNTFAFAADPVTGDFVAIDENGAISTLNITDGTHSSIGTVVVPNTVYGVRSLQFNGAGTLWVEADTNEGQNTELWSFTRSTIAAPILSGIFADAPYFTEAVLIVPAAEKKAALANTGSAGFDLLPSALGGGALVLGGTLMLASAQVRRRIGARTRS